MDQRRNVVGAPAAGWDPTEVVDVGPLIADITRRLIDDDRPAHPKSGVVVDGGGTISLRGRRATVALAAAARRPRHGAVVYEVAAAEAVPVGPRHRARSTAVVDAGAAAAIAVEALTSPSATATLERVDVTGLHTPDARRGGTIGPLRPVQRSGVRRRRARARAARPGAGGCRRGERPSPSRQRGAAHPVAGDPRRRPRRRWAGRDLGGLGLVVDRTDPAGAVIVCAGRTGCSSGTVDTIADGHTVVDLLRRRPAGEGPLAVHLSGCAKRCASHAAHDLTLVGADDGRGYDGYDLDEAEIFRSVTLELALGATRA